MAEPPATPPPALARIAPWVGLAAVLAVAAIAYQPAMPGPFLLDDWGSIQANGAIRSPDAVRIPSLPELLGPGRPITEITFAIDWRAARLDPVRFHRVGLALHLVATLLAYAWMLGLLRRAGHPRPRALALVIAGAFALHPIQTESVAYAAQRAEVLSALFTLAALVLLDRAARGWPGWRAGAAWSGGVLAWIAGMGAKTTAICTPGAFVLDQVVVGEAGDRTDGNLARRSLRALLLAAPLLALAAWSATLHFRSFAANPGGGAGTGATLLSPWTYFLTQLRVTWLYLRLLAWPDALAFDRSFAPSDGGDAATLAAAAAWLLVVGLAVLLWVRAERASGPRPASRLAAFGILFWFVALSPTSSFVPVADLAVEHRVYLASLGPLLAAAGGLDALLRRLLPRPRASVAGAALAGVALVALGVALRARAADYGSDVTIWRGAAAASPDNARAWSNLGFSLQQAGDLAGAEAAYGRAWSVARQVSRIASLARNHASLLLQVNRPLEALAIVDRGIEIAPGDPSLYANRAAALGKLGRNAEALGAARQAAELAPADPRMRNNLGQALYVSGDRAGALAEFLAAEALDPGDPLYPVEAGVALAALGRREEACAAFHRAAGRSGPRPLPLDAARRAAELGCPLASNGSPR